MKKQRLQSRLCGTKIVILFRAAAEKVSLDNWFSLDLCQWLCVLICSFVLVSVDLGPSINQFFVRLSINLAVFISADNMNNHQVLNHLILNFTVHPTFFCYLMIIVSFGRQCYVCDIDWRGCFLQVALC